MSSVEKELVEATKLPTKRNEDRQAFLVRLVLAVGKLDDASWNKISLDTQKWFNDAADEMNAGKPITEPPSDAPAPAAVSRRAVAAPTSGTSKAPRLFEPPRLSDLKVDDIVSVVNVWDESYSGAKVLEVDEKTLTILTDSGDEVTLRAANIKDLGFTNTDAPAPASPPAPASRRESKPAAAPAAPAAPATRAPRGQGVTQRMRELICSNLKADRAAIAKMLTEEGLKFSEATLDIMFSDTKKTIDCLIAQGKINA